MSTAAIKPRPTTEDDITAEVLRRFDSTEDPRLKHIMQSLVKHFHAFLKEVQLQECHSILANSILCWRRRSNVSGPPAHREHGRP